MIIQYFIMHYVCLTEGFWNQYGVIIWTYKKAFPGLQEQFRKRKKFHTFQT